MEEVEKMAEKTTGKVGGDGSVAKERQRRASEKRQEGTADGTRKSWDEVAMVTQEAQGGRWVKRRMEGVDA